MSRACSVPYRAADGRLHLVDRGLDHSVLDRLNALPGLRLRSVCAGHGRAGSRAAHVVFEARHFRDVRPYLDAGVSLDAFGSQSLYPARNDGRPTRWTFTIRADASRRPPSRRWWRALVATLEETAP